MEHIKDSTWYKKQVLGLKMILEDSEKEDGFVARSYLMEKLDRILEGSGINFHPLIEEAVEQIIEIKNKKRSL